MKDDFVPDHILLNMITLLSKCKCELCKSELRKREEKLSQRKTSERQRKDGEVFKIRETK